MHVTVPLHIVCTRNQVAVHGARSIIIIMLPQHYTIVNLPEHMHSWTLINSESIIL